MCHSSWEIDVNKYSHTKYLAHRRAGDHRYLMVLLMITREIFPIHVDQDNPIRFRIFPLLGICDMSSFPCQRSNCPQKSDCHSRCGTPEQFAVERMICDEGPLRVTQQEFPVIIMV